MCNPCCATSCWCAPVRFLCWCFFPIPNDDLDPVTQVAVQALGGLNPQQPSHRRERTWKVENGKMTYAISNSFVISETIVK